MPSKEELLNHMQVHPIKTVKCLGCSREFTRKYHLDRHIGQTGCMGVPRKAFDCRVRFIFLGYPSSFVAMFFFRYVRDFLRVKTT